MYPRENAYKQDRKIPYRQQESPQLRNILGYLNQLFIFSDFQMGDFPDQNYTVHASLISPSYCVIQDLKYALCNSEEQMTSAAV
jgi:hypothetical protein